MNLLEQLTKKANFDGAHLAISRTDVLDAANRRYDGILPQEYSDVSDLTAGERIKLRHDMGGTAFRLEVLSCLANEEAFPADQKSSAIRELQSTNHLNEQVPSLSFLRRLLAEAELAQETKLERVQAAARYLAFWKLDYPDHTNQPLVAPDSLFVQAFGRDSIPDRELPFVRQLRDGTDNDIDVFTQLTHNQFEPGPSNDALAENTKQLVDNDYVEAMLQWEVAYSLWRKNPEWYEDHEAALHVLWPRQDLTSYRTYHVKEDSMEIFGRRQLIGTYELAHTAMYARAVPIIRKLGQRATAVLPMPEIPFDPRSTQAQVRNRLQWIPREFLTRGHHLLTGKVDL